ncbi:hypothetical protein B0H34DRAFT_302573 [Crassisporium funariophilum]|nr:hypothetical protein B0H34DRAFT_302573 [Crassisporium funariophilum]
MRTSAEQVQTVQHAIITVESGASHFIRRKNLFLLATSWVRVLRSTDLTISCLPISKLRVVPRTSRRSYCYVLKRTICRCAQYTLAVRSLHVTLDINPCQCRVFISRQRNINLALRTRAGTQLPLRSSSINACGCVNSHWWAFQSPFEVKMAPCTPEYSMSKYRRRWKFFSPLSSS